MGLTYKIQSRNPDILPFRVRALSYNEAAHRAAKRLHGRKRGMTAVRVTGNAGMSGYYQAYVPVKTGGLTSYGDNFHVQKVVES